VENDRVCGDSAAVRTRRKPRERSSKRLVPEQDDLEMEILVVDPSRYEPAKVILHVRD